MRGAFFVAPSRLLLEGGGGVALDVEAAERLERPQRAGLRLDKKEDLGVLPLDDLSFPE